MSVIVTATTPPFLALATASYASPNVCPTQSNEALDLPNGTVLYGCSTDGSPVEIVDDGALTSLGTIAATPPAGASGFWSAARIGGTGAMLGWVGVVLDASATKTTSVRARFQNASAYRGAIGVGTDQIWAVRDDGVLDVISLADPANPLVVVDAPLGVTGAYQLRLSPDGTRALVITNHGQLVVIDATTLPAASLTWPSF